MVHVLTWSVTSNGKLGRAQTHIHILHLCYENIRRTQTGHNVNKTLRVNREYQLLHRPIVSMQRLFLPALYLQVCAQEGLPLGVLVVVPHQQVEQGRRLGPHRRQLGDTALKHLAAQSLAQRHPALKQHWRELKGQGVSVLKSDWGQGWETLSVWSEGQRKMTVSQ